MASYYKHSGKISPQGLILGLLLGAAVSLPASFLYDYGIFTIPEAKLRGICTLAFGSLIGAASGAGMCWGKLRSKLVAGTFRMAFRSASRHLASARPVAGNAGRKRGGHVEL